MNMKKILLSASCLFGTQIYASSPETFASYCTKTIQSENSASEQLTLAALARLVSNKNPANAKECESLELSLAKRTSLYLKKKGLTSLKPLSYLPHIEEINAAGNAVADLDGFRDLPLLKILDLSDNDLKNIDPLESFRSLTDLRLGKNQIKDLSPLAKIATLEDLSLQSNSLKSVEALYPSRSLKYLNLSSNELTDVSGLAEIKSLEALTVTFNKICDVQTLKEALAETTRLIGADAQKCESAF